ncbi:MAG TPA: RluA family pseudouridine synthase [Ktedonobacteraceae bacterium]|nr:RluA family pseudouridine synthase [Ktedonobacteraceae bacterium]
MHHSNELSSEAKHVWHIEPEQVGMRLDRFLVSVLSDISRTAGQQLIAEGAVLVNRRAAKVGYLLRLNDEVRLLRTGPAMISQDVKPQQLPLHIVYEDDNLLVIDKEAGMVVHPAAGHHDDTLVNALLARYPELRQVAAEIRPGIVHRLDKDTSGLLIVAKNLRTQAAMIEQMQRHQVEKRYLALVEGLVSLDQGSIDAPIGRDPRHRQQMTITAQEGREARTHFRVQQRYARHTLLLLQLETGRTHQIRVHLKAIGHPVVGDPVYGSRHSQLQLPLQRQFLHAYQLKFTHPTTGKALEFTAPLPDDLQKILARENIL